jgi:hypothetical protein
MRFFQASLRGIVEKKHLMKLALGVLIGTLLISISIHLVPITTDTHPRITGSHIMESLRALEDSEIVFEDRMRIELKKGSKIMYPTRGNGIDFDIVLLGEAQFKIMRGYSVSVEYNEIIVEATGAIFSIEKGDGTIEVIVTDNQAFIIMNKQHVVVHAFQRAVYNVSTKRVTIVDMDIKKT